MAKMVQSTQTDFQISDCMFCHQLNNQIEDITKDKIKLLLQFDQKLSENKVLRDKLKFEDKYLNKESQTSFQKSSPSFLKRKKTKNGKNDLPQNVNIEVGQSVEAIGNGVKSSSGSLEPLSDQQLDFMIQKQQEEVTLASKNQ